jgi:Ser/Thr protein kinase RdoA (MazF antagonist)
MKDDGRVRPFFTISYLAQVRRLRRFAYEVLERYRIKVQLVEFINHGENATFKVTAGRGKKYLLRVHRNDYHCREAIGEELAWLTNLAESGEHVPVPVVSGNGHVVETVSMPELDLSRHCSLFEWVDGRFIEKSVKHGTMRKIGELLARLQNRAPKTRYRRYWDAEGLLGAGAKFGSIDALAGVLRKEQQIITSARETTLAILHRYQNRFPERTGLIHADLHFGNLLATNSGLGAIDFDDCGHGFHVYDLVIPCLSVANILGESRKGELPAFKMALFDGYRSIRAFDGEDEALFPHLLTARRLLMLGWMNSRSDNPRIRQQFRAAVDRSLKHISSEGIV